MCEVVKDEADFRAKLDALVEKKPSPMSAPPLYSPASPPPGEMRALILEVTTGEQAD